MPPIDKSKPAVTIRSLAKLAGVSAMTVSLALRNHPHAAAKTRARVQKLAQQQGYQPDPTISKLMQHLRSRRATRIKATLCAFISNTYLHEYAREIIAAAKRRAKHLGYAFDEIRLNDYEGHMPRLQNVLSSRGVEGILLMPLKDLTEVAAGLDWSAYSLVALSYSVLNLSVHHVVPHQFANCTTLCRELGRRGYSRLGLVISREQDVRVQHHYTAALAWHNLQHGRERVAPLIYERWSVAALRQWVKTKRPDAIIAGSDDIVAQILAALGGFGKRPVKVVSLSLSRRSAVSGIDERPQEVGARAVDLLAGMIQLGERGLPGTPVSIMVEGECIFRP